MTNIVLLKIWDDMPMKRKLSNMAIFASFFSKVRFEYNKK